MLGPVLVRVAPSGQPTVAADRRPYFTEIVAYLVTRPHGATTDELVDALGISSGRVRKDMLNVRAWLGTNPRTGRPHLPDSRQTDAARQRGRNTYQLEDVLVDADLFRRLRARGEARDPEGLDDLRAALALVAGPPFEDLRATGGMWLYDGVRLDQILLCAIVDIAHVVTTAALTTGDLDQAQQATELALRAAPLEEGPRLDLAAILTARGHRSAADRLLRDEVCNRSDEEDGAPTDLPPRTEQVIAQRQWLLRPTTKASA